MNKSVLLLLQSPWGDEMKQASARKNRVWILMPYLYGFISI